MAERGRLIALEYNKTWRRSGPLVARRTAEPLLDLPEFAQNTVFIL